MDRRLFVKNTTIFSASMLPVINTINVFTGKPLKDMEKLIRDQELSGHYLKLVDNNLLNLNFYFINTVSKGSNLIPANPAEPSFMIVRLPQMHVSEKGFWDEDWQHDDRKFAEARLSGYSYLAFEIWPNHRIKEDEQKDFDLIGWRKKNKLKVTLDNLLNWNDSNLFDLVTLVEWTRLKRKDDQKFDYAGLPGTADFSKRKIWHKNDAEVNADYAEGFYQTSVNEPKSSQNFKKYKSIIKTLLDKNFGVAGSERFVPITLLEIPEGLFLIPVIRGAVNGLLLKAGDLKKRFWSNKYVNQQRSPEGERRYEVWLNSLFLDGNPAADQANKDNSFIIQAPGFRAIGLIAEKNSFQKLATDCQAFCDAQKGNNFLPSLLDKAELTYLTQYAKDNTDFSQPEFDIKEQNGLFFTGLGVITHLKYYNVDKRPPGVDLIEYEHRITEGRDIFIKVSRLGYNSKNGARYKHVIEGRRIINAAGEAGKNSPSASFIQLKQYCEVIDPVIEYQQKEVYSDNWHTNFHNIPGTGAASQTILLPVSSNKPDFKRHTFSKLNIIERERIPIQVVYQGVVQVPDVCRLQCLPWFWPVREDASGAGQTDLTIKHDDYLLCEQEGSDWEGKTVRSRTPFMFLRASYLEAGNMSEAYADYFRGDMLTLLGPENILLKEQNIVDRRKVFYQNQLIAFAPSADTQLLNEKASLQAYIKNNTGNKSAIITAESKAARISAQLNDPNGSKSKVNILETEFIEMYFHAKKPGSFVDNDIIKSNYVIYPQVLRAKVFVDHIKDLTQQKIASVIEYHSDYITHGLKEVTGFQNEYANGAKIILANTKAFVNKAEEKINNSYDDISVALQKAKSRLGNLAVPDIIPDTISLEYGITLVNDLRGSIDKGRTAIEKVTNGTDQLQRIASMSPRELLRGKLSDVCGLDLTAVLDELIPAGENNNHTPLFEITKTLNKLQGAILNSPIYQEIIDFKITDPLVGDKVAPEVLLKRYEDKMASALATIEQKRVVLNASIKELSTVFLNADELDHLVKDLFERYRTQAFEVLLDKIPADKIKDTIDKARALIEGVHTGGTEIKGFLENEKILIKRQLEEKKLAVEQFIKDLAVMVTKLPNGLQLVNNDQLDSYITNTLMKNIDDGITNFLNIGIKLNLLYKTTGKINLPGVFIVKGNGAIQLTNTQAANTEPLTVIEFKLNIADGIPANVGLIQLENEFLRLQEIIINNINGTQAQQKAVELIQKYLKQFTAYNNGTVDVNVYQALIDRVQRFQDQDLGRIVSDLNSWRRRSEELLNSALSAGQRDMVIKAKLTVDALMPSIDLLRKLDPYFYYAGQQRLKKQIQDVKLRFSGALADRFGKTEILADLNCDCDKVDPQTGMPVFESVLCEIKCCLQHYQSSTEKLIKYLSNTNAPDAPALFKAYTEENRIYVTERLASIPKRALTAIKNIPGYTQLQQLYNNIDQIKADIQKAEEQLKVVVNYYKTILQEQADHYALGLEDSVAKFIRKREDELANAVGPEIAVVEEKIRQAKNIYQLLTSIKQQELSYTWSTDRFRDVNLGVVEFKKFTNPDTRLQVNVKGTTYFSSGKFPPVIERVEFLSENRFTNFGISFFNSLTIGFNEISFIAGSNRSTHFDVKIKDVKFDGALSFVQAFEAWLQTMGKGLILQVLADRVALGYSLPIPAIKTPGFNIFNLSLNLDLRLFFDNRPLRFGFSLARPDSKFGIAVGIYAGFGFFGIEVDPKLGIVSVDCTLEAGAWAGLSMGVIHGEVKLAFGFRYTKNEFGVRLEGYIVAEGRLKVWIIEVSARIYLGVVSQNSYVEGVCTVRYSVKVGFIKKSFSGSFRRKIAGAKSQNQQQQAARLLEVMDHISKATGSSFRAANFDLQSQLSSHLETLEATQAGEMETNPVSFEAWKQFINIF